MPSFLHPWFAHFRFVDDPRAAYVGAVNGSRLPSCTVERRSSSFGGGAHLSRCGSTGMVAARNRSFEREHAKDAFVDERRESLQVGQWESCKIASLLLRMVHCARDHLVRIAEGHALAHQIVRQIRRSGETFARGGAHSLGNGREAGFDEL